MPIVEVCEWKSCDRPDLNLTADDRALAKSLAQEGKCRLIVEERRRGIRITARSWVGVVRFTEFEVHVRPKLAGDNLRLLQMIEFTTGLNTLKHYSSVLKLAAGGGNLLDLIMLMFVEECERILRGGLLSDYVEEEEELPVVRGRMLFDRQIRKRLGRLDLIHCRHDERKQDVPENQLLAYVLDVCARHAFQPTLRRKARQLEHHLLGSCDPSLLDLVTTRGGIYYDRMNEHYRDAHELCWLIVDALGISDIYSSGSSRIFAFLLDMNRLFEVFVLQVLRQLTSTTALKVSYQSSDRSIIRDSATNQPYSSVIPDFLIAAPSLSGKLVLDAKYKLYDAAGVSNSDIYQSFFYAYAFGRHQLGGHVAGLIYPSESTTASRKELTVRSQFNANAARVVLIGLPIPAVLDEAKSHVWGPATAPLQTFLAEFNKA
nr:McrC family protein [Pirellula staleyi]